MTETEKLLKFYERFYYKMWEQNWVSSDKVHEWKQEVASDLGYSVDNIDTHIVSHQLGIIQRTTHEGEGL